MKKPLVIGIAGGTCSGKSYLCDMIEKNLREQNIKLKVFHMDEYYMENPPTTIAPITRKVYVEHNHPDSLELDRFYKDFTKTLENGEFEAIIVEGVFVFLLQNIREKLDMKVFVDLRDDERVVRRLKRHANWGQGFDEIAERYLDTVRYRHDEFVEPTRWFADLVLNGAFDYHNGADMLLDLIMLRLK